MSHEREKLTHQKSTNNCILKRKGALIVEPFQPPLYRFQIELVERVRVKNRALKHTYP